MTQSPRRGRWIDLANPTRFLSLAGAHPAVARRTYRTRAGHRLLDVDATRPTITSRARRCEIMYIHVPFAWLSMMCYTIMSVAALGTLVWRHPLADVSAKAAAPIGAVFTALALVTGSLWGKPMWGTWWVWDARLTSVFVLFLMYLGLIALNRAMDDPARSARVTAVLILVGFVNIPIIKFSVEWWNTLHQPASRPAPRWLNHRSVISCAAAGHGDRFHPAVLHAASDGDAQRDLAPPRHVDAPRCCPQRRSGNSVMISHTGFVLASYGAAIIVLAALIGWIFIDGRSQRRRCRSWNRAGVRRRSETQDG